MKFLFLFMLALGVVACSHSQKRKCPENYVEYPGTQKFCVAKFEMKKGKHGEAISVPEGTPWDYVNRAEAIAACKKNGENFDLITIDHWTLIARNIADQSVNWNTGTAYLGSLNIGHADGGPDRPLQASSNDDEACFETRQSCNLTSWNLQRRTHQLSNGQVIWDLSGNMAEWVKDLNDKTIIAPQGYVISIDPKAKPYSRFGPDRICNDMDNYCGYGYYWTHDVGRNGIGRSGFWKHNHPYMAGIFALGCDLIPEKKYNLVGFRCVYTPEN